MPIAIRLLLPALSLLTALTVAPKEAQAQEQEPSGHSRHGEAFNEGPRQGAYVMDGMSDQVHMPIAGLSPQAQKLFDQGITQLHGFWNFESERSFRQVAKLHPDCAMAYWGMTLANLESVSRASGFIARAVEQAGEVPRNEQLWIDSWAAYYQIDAEVKLELRSKDVERVKAATAALVAKNEKRTKEEKLTLDKQLLKDIGTIVYEFPEDIEAKALLAVQIWLAYDWGSGIPIVSHTAVDALLDQVLAKAPLHPAHHYRVHLWDAEKGERALRSAAALGDSAPGIAHQWHMAGHIYAKLHRHADAAWQQEASSRVDHGHMQRDRVMPFEIHNYGHNQEWLSRSLSFQGRVDEALATAKNLAELPRHPKKNDIGDPEGIANYARAALTQLCEEHGLWETALQLESDGYLEPCDDVAAEVLRLSMVGRALYRLGHVSDAERIVAEVDGLLPRARAERAKAVDKAEDEALDEKLASKETDKVLERAQRHGTDVVRAVLELKRELAAEKLLAEGNDAGAAAAFAAIEHFPETLLTDAQVAAGDAKSAIELLEKVVGKEPNRLPTLGRLVLAYRAANDPAHSEKLTQREAELAKMVAASGPLAQRLGLPPPRAVTIADFGADFGKRPELTSIGPKNWSPTQAPAFELPVAGGGSRTVAAPFGKPTLVVFYLGFGCLHCIEQLEAIAPLASAFADAGIDIVAIGTDDLETASNSVQSASEDERFPFPLLADPTLRVFKEWRCFDDFEDIPLHGTFLVDGAGNVRWQDISFEPFTEVEWLVSESRRLLALPKPLKIATR